jgi:hypothetical protein
MTEEKTTNNCINLGSYNYLGFAENSGPVTDQAIAACKQYGLATCSTRHEVKRSESQTTPFLASSKMYLFFDLIQWKQDYVEHRTCIETIQVSISPTFFSSLFV